MPLTSVKVICQYRSIRPVSAPNCEYKNRNALGTVVSIVSKMNLFHEQNAHHVTHEKFVQFAPCWASYWFSSDNP